MVNNGSNSIKDIGTVSGLDVAPELHTKELLEAILSSIGSGVMVCNSEGKFLLFNEMATQILGLGATTAPPENWAQFYGLYQADKKTLLKEEQIPLVRAMNGETVDKIQVYVRNRGVPSGIWCSVNARPLVSLTGERVGGVVVFEDITKRKVLADEVARSNRDLQQFAYAAAHDLQEPIRSIVGFTDLLIARLQNTLDEKSADQLKRVHAAAQRMQGLINALLAFARIETRSKPPEPCNCTRILDEVIANMHGTITQTGASIETDDLPTVVADKSQITQLFQNLISNALKYKKESEAPRVTITSSRVPGAHQFAITDNGIGIDMTYAEKIFVIFQRLHTKEEFPGSGVGLALCKKIVERHGGEIWLKSEPNKGSTFFFTLPAKDNIDNEKH
jgi:PAS domain S-box-containing protein